MHCMVPVVALISVAKKDGIGLVVCWWGDGKRATPKLKPSALLFDFPSPAPAL